MRTKEGFLAFATNSGGVHVQVAGSPDLLHWALLEERGRRRDALPVLPPWVSPDHPDVWAPEVLKLGATYNLYFSARSRDQRNDRGLKECVGMAVGKVAEGPYTPQAHPLECDGLPSGAIDPDPFRDGARLYLYFKRDGNCCGRGSGILVQDLSPDGTAVEGARIAIGVRNDKPWEGAVVEAPTMIKHDGRYVMFYSAADYAGSSYAIGYAVCERPGGSCRDAPENPILASRQARPPYLIGPGHQSILQAGGRTFMAYHAWQALPGAVQGSARFMHISEISWIGGRPRVGGLHLPLPSFKDAR